MYPNIASWMVKINIPDRPLKMLDLILEQNQLALPVHTVGNSWLLIGSDFPIWRASCRYHEVSFEQTTGLLIHSNSVTESHKTGKSTLAHYTPTATTHQHYCTAVGVEWAIIVDVYYTPTTATTGCQQQLRNLLKISPWQAAHAETVQKRQLLLRTESGLQRQSARATRVLDGSEAHFGRWKLRWFGKQFYHVLPPVN